MKAQSRSRHDDGDMTNNTKEETMYRQGDVLIVSTDIPAGATACGRDKGRIILAYGEVTGHAHAITSGAVAKLALDGIEYLRVSDTVLVEHEEHETITLPAGDYMIVHQVEHSPVDGLRRVLD